MKIRASWPASALIAGLFLIVPVVSIVGFYTDTEPYSSTWAMINGVFFFVAITAFFGIRFTYFIRLDNDSLQYRDSTRIQSIPISEIQMVHRAKFFYLYGFLLTSELAGTPVFVDKLEIIFSSSPKIDIGLSLFSRKDIKKLLLELRSRNVPVAEDPRMIHRK